MAYSQAAWERAMRMPDVILQAINGGSRTDPAESHAAPVHLRASGVSTRVLRR